MIKFRKLYQKGWPYFFPILLILVVLIALMSN